MLTVYFSILKRRYDIQWREGLIVKVHQVRIRGKMCQWIKSLSFDENNLVENGTPQGSIEV